LYAKVVENDKYKEEARIMKKKLLAAIQQGLRSKLGGKKKYKTKRNLKINKKSRKNKIRKGRGGSKKNKIKRKKKNKSKFK